MTLAEQLIARGKKEGRREAKEEAKQEAKREGILEGKREILLNQLAQKFDAVSEADKKKIEETKEPDKLDQCLVLILKSNSIEEILKPLDG